MMFAVMAMAGFLAAGMVVYDIGFRVYWSIRNAKEVRMLKRLRKTIF